MNNANKVSSKYKIASVVAFVFTLLLTVQSKNKLFQPNSFHNNLTAIEDTVKPGKRFPLPNISPKTKADTFPARNKNAGSDTSIIMEKDTMDFKISKDSLDAVVEYSAEDSMILDVPTKKITLYGKKATTQYKDNNVSAPVIEFEQATGAVSYTH